MSDLLDVGAQDYFNGESIGGAGLNETTRQFALPDGLDPLSDTLQRSNVFE